LTLSRLKANADIELLDFSGQRLQQSRNPRRRDESIGSSLNSGVYYIRVFTGNNRTKTRYQLTVASADLVPATQTPIVSPSPIPVPIPVPIPTPTPVPIPTPTTVPAPTPTPAPSPDSIGGVAATGGTAP